MPENPSQRDVTIMKVVAEYSIVTHSQLSHIIQRHPKSLARRLKMLESEGLTQKISQGFGRGRGRPELLMSLTPSGWELLMEEGGIPKNALGDLSSSKSITNVDHQVLVNWFRIHLVHLERVMPMLSVRFLSPTSPFFERDSDGRPFVFDRAPAGTKADEWIEFIPDGVFAISSTEQDSSNSLLFFLEVDMGTESLASMNNTPKDIRQKILNYQSYFRSQRFKRYECVWNCRLNGFRLLFLANSSARKAALCRLVQEMPPSDFIWVTDQESMFEKGLGANIWARGGLDHHPPASILGKLASDQTVLPTL